MQTATKPKDHESLTSPPKIQKLIRVGIWVRSDKDCVDLIWQEEICKWLASARGWHVARVYSDGFRNAFSTDLTALRCLLNEMETGMVDGFVVAHPNVLPLDRYHANAIHRATEEPRFLALASAPY